jgi:hypothetical protein
MRTRAPTLRNGASSADGAQRLLVRLQFVVLASNFLLKVLILNLAYVVFLLTSDFGTDLFTEDVDGITFLFAVVIVNAMAYAFYRGLASPHNASTDAGRLDVSLNRALVLVITAIFALSFVVLGQKILSLSASMALLSIAANSRRVACLSLAIFAAGVPQAIVLDEYIPLIFCAVLNLFVFLPWLATRGRKALLLLAVTAMLLMLALSVYYIVFRYNAFKLVERIFEQAAPISWRGNPWLWFNPYALIGGMPEERELLVLDGTWDAQFKVTYLIVNAPILGTAFLLAFAYVLGRFTGSTVLNCQLPGSNVLTNFLRLKLLLILIELMGEKVTDPIKITVYVLLILGITAFESLWTAGSQQHRRSQTT